MQCLIRAIFSKEFSRNFSGKERVYLCPHSLFSAENTASCAFCYTVSPERLFGCVARRRHDGSIISLFCKSFRFPPFPSFHLMPTEQTNGIEIKVSHTRGEWRRKRNCPFQCLLLLQNTWELKRMGNASALVCE